MSGAARGLVHRPQSDNLTQAVRYLLAACRDAGGLDAMVLVDHDGLILAVAGDLEASQAAAVRIADMTIEPASFRGTLLGEDRTWAMHLQRLEVTGLALYACGIGGHADGRARQVARAALGIERILA